MQFSETVFLKSSKSYLLSSTNYFSKLVKSMYNDICNSFYGFNKDNE